MSGNEVTFGQFRLDLKTRTLSRDGAPIALAGRALDILCVLAAARGNVVTKDDLMAQVWPGRIVEDNNIQVHVSALRKALDEHRDGRSHVVTVPGRGYRLIDLEMPAARAPVSTAAQDRPGIAVLPFDNMSSDPGQEHFADGVVEEIITGLSRIRWLSVIARQSSFAYRGRSVDVRQIGRDLGVHYVLEGSVRKSGDRVRITGQLIDAASGAHIWAERFDGDLKDVFDLQDRVTASVVGVIEPTVVTAELERTQSRPAATAWDYFALGLAKQRLLTRDANAQAMQLFRQSIALNEDFPSAYAFASNCYTWAKSFGWLTDPAAEISEGIWLARRALELGRDEAAISTVAGFALAYLAGDLDTGQAAFDRSLSLHPNFAPSWGLGCWIRVWRGEPEVGIAHAERAMQLSPSDFHLFAWQSARAYAHYSCEQYDEARAWADKASHERPGYLPAERMVAAAAALAGQTKQAKAAMVRLRELEPTLSISKLKEQIPYQRAEDLARFAAGLRKAGLPE
jgi:TolB-like protein/tetratricopeptide (TPR) repeat protein